VLKKDFPQFFDSHGIFDREKFLAELPEQPFPEPYTGISCIVCWKRVCLSAGNARFQHCDRSGLQGIIYG
jgi:hypothetical protein